jgi:hypothetical protein
MTNKSKCSIIDLSIKQGEKTMWHSPFSYLNIESTREYFKTELEIPFNTPIWYFCEDIAYGKDEFYFCALVRSYACKGIHLVDGVIHRDGRLLSCQISYSWEDTHNSKDVQELIDWIYTNMVKTLDK